MKDSTLSGVLPAGLECKAKAQGWSGTHLLTSLTLVFSLVKEE